MTGNHTPSVDNPAARPVVVAPDRWCGECDCDVGPFAERHVAHAFVGLGAEHGSYEVFRFQLFSAPGGWYLRITRAAPPPTAPPPRTTDPIPAGSP